MELVLSDALLPARMTSATGLSDRDLLNFCAVNDHLRIERETNGDLLIMSPSGSRTSMMNARIGRILSEWAEVDGRGTAFESSGGFTLPDGSIRSPDAAWIENTRWDALTREQQDGFAPLCPDFVLELRSPTDSSASLELKMESWIANGAQLGWLIDPHSKNIVIYRPGSRPERHYNPTTIHGDGPLQKFQLAIAVIWN